MTGGVVYVDGPTNSGNGAIDKNGTALIHGGTLVAVGAAGMAETFDSASTQGCILLNTSSTHAAGTKIELLDASGTVLVSYTPTKSFSNIVISDPSIVVGSTYTLKVGTEVSEITMTTTSYGSGSGSGMDGHGGFGGFGGGHGGKKDSGDANRPDGAGRPGMTAPDGNVPGQPGTDAPDGGASTPPDFTS